MMAWWDAKYRRRGAPSPAASIPLRSSKKDLVMGDAFPKLDTRQPTTKTTQPTVMEPERAFLSPISEEQPSPLPLRTPPLVVHVSIQFTDPVIKSRYTRSYGSSPTFEPTTRICNGLLRRIEHCSKEFITRKDSTALDMYKDDTSDEHKPLRFEMTFRIVRRGMGEWAERTFRSYQKQSLTVAITKDVIQASQRMVGLFLRRHDKDFQWFDGPVCDNDAEAPETMSPSLDDPVSLLCIPRSRFIESFQDFEFVPGYTIHLSFRNRNPRREVAAFRRTIKLNSNQPAPLSLLISENILWRGLQAINEGLESRKQDFDAHLKTCRKPDCQHFHNDALDIDLTVSNNLGPLYDVHRKIKSNLSLFQDPEARDCDDFVRAVEASLLEARDDGDSKMEGMDDFELSIVELKGMRWSRREPAKFSLGPAASYGRRTIQAALDRVQTGIGDVLRGHNVAVHISAHKRGHLIIDKAIIAHEKHGRPVDIFSSLEEEEAAFVSRLKTRIQQDIDMVFKDTCSINDIAEDEDEARVLPSPEPEADHAEKRPGVLQGESPRKRIKTYPTHLQGRSPTKPLIRRTFSLGRRSSSASSVRSARNLDDFRSGVVGSENGSRRSSMDFATTLEDHTFFAEPVPSVMESPTKSVQRRFSLMPSTSSTSTRVSSGSTLLGDTSILLEDSDTANAERKNPNSTDADTVKAERSDSQKGLRIASCPTMTNRLSSMTLSDVVGADARNSAGADPAKSYSVLRLAGYLSSNLPTRCTTAPQGQNYKLDEQEIQGIFKQADRSEMATPPAADTPYEDAEEFPTQGLDLHKTAAKCHNIQSTLHELTSPGSDEYSTAPSTPALSSGGDSSPRHSLLETPIYLRTVSGTKDLILRDFEPDSEPEESETMRVEESEMNGAARPRKEKEEPTAPPSSFNPSPESNELITDGTDNQNSEESSSPGLQSLLGYGEKSSSAATEDESAAPDEPAEPTASGICSPPPTPQDEEAIGLSEDEFYDKKLGAESVAEPDVCSSECPDFPIQEVRRSAVNHAADSNALPEPQISEGNSGPDDGTEFAELVALLVDEKSATDPIDACYSAEVDASQTTGCSGDLAVASETPETQKDGSEAEIRPLGLELADEFDESAPASAVEEEEETPGVDAGTQVGPDISNAPKEAEADIETVNKAPELATDSQVNKIQPVGEPVGPATKAPGIEEAHSTGPDAEADALDCTVTGKTISAPLDNHSIQDAPAETVAEVGDVSVAQLQTSQGPDHSEGEADRAVGVLDQNVGTEPGTDVVEDTGRRPSNAAEVCSDMICHEYSTGNRIGVAAVCDAPGPEVTDAPSAREESEPKTEGADDVAAVSKAEQLTEPEPDPETQAEGRDGVVSEEQQIELEPELEVSDHVSVSGEDPEEPEPEPAPEPQAEETDNVVLSEKEDGAEHKPHAEEADNIVVPEQDDGAESDPQVERTEIVGSEEEQTVPEYHVDDVISELEKIAEPEIQVSENFIPEKLDQTELGAQTEGIVFEEKKQPESEANPVAPEEISVDEFSAPAPRLSEDSLFNPADDMIVPECLAASEAPTNIAPDEECCFHHPINLAGGEFNPLFATPFPPVSARSCASSISEMSEVGRRGSVDTFRENDEDGDQLHPSEEEEFNFNRPPTAGWMGLGDTRRIRVGLHPGKDIRRFSLPLQYMLDRNDEGGAAGDGEAAAGGPSKKKSGSGRKWSKVRKVLSRAETQSQLPTVTSTRRVREENKKKDADSDDEESAVPRIWMLLAGTAAIAKMVKGSTIY
ncbi:hypothetical protein B0H66DRAFT_539986 [Apodospora peruviana]|uniref:Pt repeat family protein n=1 Tax=Apodospora peruviana TaxID=516989 RepID=A0AAE0IQC6_9PEZI|nr:hypothetical protein B0H66DRAFT_539986 [Apodospora peruviana]